MINKDEQNQTLKTDSNYKQETADLNYKKQNEPEVVRQNEKVDELTEQTSDSTKIVEKKYLEHSRKKILILSVMSFAVFILFIVSISLGQVEIPFFEVLEILFTQPRSVASVVVWRIRFPRAIGALLIGACLAISGTVMQCILRNPLASPYTLGTSNAAAFGAAFGMVVLGGGVIVGQTNSSWAIENIYIVSVSAFVWAMIATLILLLLIKKMRPTAEVIILTGIALNALFSSALAAVQYFAMELAFTSIVLWMFGDLGKISNSQNFLIFTVFIPIMTYFILKRWDYNAMEPGDDVAKGLGVDTNRTRIISLVLATVITALSISFVGIIGFIGLLAPHITRRIIGNDHRYLLVGSMIFGAGLLLLADTVARLALSYTIPVGIITSFLGSPLFFYILIRRSRNSA